MKQCSKNNIFECRPKTDNMILSVPSYEYRVFFTRQWTMSQ